jgi:hypothetical protein
MSSLKSIGTSIDSINVELSYKIIELFSAGLYSSPNKAFEELICNAYDAYADIVSVYMSSDLAKENAYIMVCDNGEGLTQDEFKNLWRIGESNKRNTPDRDARRLQIGQFGIGKLSTYILARSLTHISKKDNRYIMTTMDYNEINTDTKIIKLPEVELTETESQELLAPYIFSDGMELVEFALFGDKAISSWTISLLTDLKPKATEVQIGRLKWILSTALPLSPSFALFLNGNKIESSKARIAVIKEWIIGKEDQVAEELDFATPHKERDSDNYYVDFEKLNHVTGKFILYEQSLLGGKAADNGRSHGIFLTIRGRLINLDDPLLGMEPFSHGPFNHCQILIQADGLDAYLTSTRESVKESIPLAQLKEYVKKKFNNELRKFYFDMEDAEEKKKTVAYRLAQTSYSASRKPIKSFIQKFYEGAIENPILIKKPTPKTIEEILPKYEKEADGSINSIENIEWSILDSNAPIASLCLETKTLSINSLHPFVANYSDSFKNTLPLENIVITEVLTEAYMYELGIDESHINAVMRGRDRTLRQLAYSDNDGIPAVAQLLRDSLSNATGLEIAVYRALLALGFETVKIGGNGKPDGHATAQLGHNADGSSKRYSLTYDAKSTSGKKIAAGTAKLSGLKRHQEDFKADYCFEVAIGYEGEDDLNSAISKEAIQQRVTVMKAKDLAQILLYSIPNQLGLSHLEDLFKTCYAPLDVSFWVDSFVKSTPEKGPYYALIDIVYDFQIRDTEPPTVEVIRLKINEQLKAKYSTGNIKTYLESLRNIIPGQFHFDGTYAYVDAKPDIVKSNIGQAIKDTIPVVAQDIYKAMFL